MSDRTSIDRVLDAFLAEGPDSVGDQAVMRALDAVDRTKQRRDVFAPWRFSLMITLPRLAALALVAVIAIGGIAFALGRQASVGSNGATPTPPGPSPTAGAAAPSGDLGMSLDTSTWTTFDTSRYGYQVAWPNTAVWMNQAATIDWTGETADEMWASTANAPWVDKFYDRTTDVTLTAVATTIPVGTTEDAFIDTYEKHAASDPCVELAKDMTQIVVDSHPARETTKCSGQAAFVTIGRTVYVFEISAKNQVPFLNAYLSTVRLPADTTSWVPFTSHFYGFSVSHPADWTVAPGTGRWTTTQSDAALDILTSPSGPPSPVNNPNFMAYENKIPSGMTADAFIQSYTSTAYAGACYPAPSATQQFTVDGHPATLAFAGCTAAYYFAEVTVVLGDRVWFFDLHGPNRAAIVPFLSTVKLDPTKTID